jgi:hypothetical protein
MCFPYTPVNIEAIFNLSRTMKNFKLTGKVTRNGGSYFLQQFVSKKFAVV